MLKVNFEPFPILQTQRTWLRKLKAQDATAFSELRSTPEITRYTETKALSIEEADKLIQKLNNFAKNNHSIFWALDAKPQEKLIGTACLWNFSTEHERAELGYELHPLYQGRGLMQEAVAGVISYGFNELKLKAIEAVVQSGNTASIRLLDHLNFKRDESAETRIGSSELGANHVYTLLRA